MNSRTTMWALVIIVIIAIAALLVFAAAGPSSLPQTTTTGATSTVQTVEATFTCDGGKTIQAMFMNASSSTTTGNSVMLALSDGTQLTLQQTMSADGARYSDGDPQVANGQPGAETTVFWNVGNTATFMQNGTSTYNNCVSQNSQ